MPHVLAVQIGRDGRRRLVLQEPPRRLGHAGPVRLDAFVGDGLDDHAGDVERGRVPGVDGRLDVGVYGDAGDGGDVAEGNGLAEETEGIAATGAAEGPVLVVGGGVVPWAEAGAFGRGTEARRLVHVAHC